MGKISLLWGREPAATLAVVASIVMVFTSFVYPLTPDQQGALNASAMALVGILTAWSVAEDGGIALVTGAAKAVIALGLAFGLHLIPEQQAVIMTFVTVIAQFVVVRPNVVAPVTASGTAAKGKSLS